MAPVPDPLSWSHLTFGDATAWIDFLGQHGLWHRALDVTVRSAGGAPYASLPLGDGGGDAWHLAHQQAHDGAARALGIAAAPDLQSYDLQDPDQFSTWTFLHSLEHVRVRRAAGI